jgi:hypothetical protein
LACAADPGFTGRPPLSSPHDGRRFYAKYGRQRDGGLKYDDHVGSIRGRDSLISSRRPDGSRRDTGAVSPIGPKFQVFVPATAQIDEYI